MKPRLPILFLALCLSATVCSAGTIGQLPTPPGFKRIACAPDSFSAFLRQLPLKPDKTIYRYDGQRLYRPFYAVMAVLDVPLLFNRDLEQCADFCMRLWSDFHKKLNKLDRLYLFDYNGNKKYFSDSGKSFEQFLKWHMAYSNSYGLKKGGREVDTEQLRPGDMFVQNRTGGIGHVSMVVDAAVNDSGVHIYLIGYGFMPAQEFHIEFAQPDCGIDGWFTRRGYERYLDAYPFRVYGKAVIRRFE